MEDSSSSYTLLWNNDVKEDDMNVDMDVQNRESISKMKRLSIEKSTNSKIDKKKVIVVKIG